MIAKFVDREEEIKAIKEFVSRPNFGLLIIYGRRRVGKTRLIIESLKGLEYIYYFATESGNIEKFREEVSRTVEEIKHAKPSWESFFHFLKDKIIVIDEFPNLIKEDKGVISTFQKIIDTELINTKTKLILIGSSISMMKSKVLSYSSPLYGRRTGQIKLRPLRYYYLREFFPNASFRELVEIYGFAGGVPYYLEKVETPFWEWLDKELKDPKSFIREEGDFILKYEFEELTTYKKILEAIAKGHTKFGEIKSFVGKESITEYLKNLIELEFIERVVPIGSKRGFYRIRDNFLRFWFRYIYPNLSRIELGIFSAEKIRKDYDRYLGETCEKIAFEFIAEKIKRNELPEVNVLGKFLHKGKEIDLVGLGEDIGIFCEVKWGKITEKDIKSIIRRLDENSRVFDLKEKMYIIIAREFGKKVKQENVLLFDVNDLFLL